MNPAGGQVKLELAEGKYSKTPEPWIRQVVSVTRSTDKAGKILSGVPQSVDVWVAKTWQQTEDEWVTEVFNRAIRD